MLSIRSLRLIDTRVRARALSLVLLPLTLALLTACTSSPYDPAVVARGEELFAANCATCHGVGGEGAANWHVTKDDGTLPPPPLNGDGHTWHHGDGLLYRIVGNGGAEFEDPRFGSFKSAMPGFGERFSHDDIVAVLTYVKSLWDGKTSRGISIAESQARASENDPFPPGGG